VVCNLGILSISLSIAVVTFFKLLGSEFGMVAVDRVEILRGSGEISFNVVSRLLFVCLDVFDDELKHVAMMHVHCYIIVSFCAK